MADTGKSIRSARTTFNGGNIGGGMPTERSQLVAQEVHQYRSESEGLEGLNGALDRFFGLTSQAVQSVRDGLAVGEAAKIEQENAAQKRQAAGDALLGKDMDPSLTNDLDYYNAFRAVRSQRDGFQAAQEFQSWYLSDWLPQNPTGNLAVAREEWAAANLTGSDDPEYEGQLLAAFFGQSDSLVSQHVETAYKYQTQKGVQMLGEAVSAKVASGTMTAADLPVFFDQARALDPLNAAEAPARVMSALLAAANNNPSQAMAISQLLQQPGTGMNGKSYAESWPENFSDFQKTAEQNWSSINTMREAEAIDKLKASYRAAKTPEDYVNLQADIVEFHQTFGAHGATETLENGIVTAMGKIEEKMAAQASSSAWMAGDPEGDPAELMDHWGDFIEAQTGERNVLKLDPSMGAQIVQDLRGKVPGELRDQLSAAVADPRDPEAQARAFHFMATLADNAGLDYATDYLNDTAGSLYRMVHSRMMLTGEDIAPILEQVNTAAAEVSDWNLGWDKITHTTAEADWRPKVQNGLIDALAQATGTSSLFDWSPAMIPAGVMKELEEVARQQALLADAAGFGWETGLKNAAEMVAKTVEVVPGPDGTERMRFGVYPESLTYVDENGKEQTRVRFGVAVNNPLWKTTVNTVEVFREDARALRETAMWVIPGGDPEAIAVREAKSDSTLGRYGLFSVEVDGRPIVYSPGQDIQAAVFGNMFGGSSVPIMRNGRVVGYEPAPAESPTSFKFPSTDEELQSLAAQMPDGFAWVPITFGNQTSYRLAYRPHFGDQTGQTIDQKEAGFQTPEIMEPQQGIRDFLMGEDPLP